MKLVSVMKRRLLITRIYVLPEMYTGYCTANHVPAGFLALYILSNIPELEFLVMYAEENGDVGVPKNSLVLTAAEFREKFTCVKELAETFDELRLDSWRLKCRYKGSDITFDWGGDGFPLRVFTLPESTIDPDSILQAVEDASYEYHCFDKKVVDDLKRKHHLSQKEAILGLHALDNLTKSPGK